MRIGIACGCKGRKSIFKIYAVDRIESFTDDINDIEFVAIGLPKSKHRWKKALIKAKRREKLDKIIATRQIKTEIADKELIVDGRKLFNHFIADTVRKMMKKCNINFGYARLGVISGEALKAGGIIKNICCNAKYITVYTDDLSAEAMCLEIYTETGLVVDLKSPEKAAKAFDDVLIDMEKNKIRIGRDVVIDKLDIGFNCGKYDVDQFDIVECLGYESKNWTVHAYMCGKNRLTI